MRRLGLLSLVCKLLEVLMPWATLTPTRMYETVDISIRFNKEHQARLCQPPPVSKWDPSLLSLQGWDSIPCQGGWRPWKRHWFTYLSLTSVLQHSIVDLQCCDHCQCTSQDSDITFLCGMSVVVWTFAIEQRVECWASGPSKLSISDTLFCGYKEGR